MSRHSCQHPRPHLRLSPPLTQRLSFDNRTERKTTNRAVKITTVHLACKSLATCTDGSLPPIAFCILHLRDLLHAVLVSCLFGLVLQSKIVHTCTVPKPCASFPKQKRVFVVFVFFVKFGRSVASQPSPPLQHCRQSDRERHHRIRKWIGFIIPLTANKLSMAVASPPSQ